MYSVTRQETVRNGDFLIDSGAATSLGGQLEVGQTQWTWHGAPVSHGTSIHDDGQHDDLLAHTRWYQRVERLSDRTKKSGLQRSIISVGQVCERGNIITFRNAGNNIEFGRVKWCASTVGGHVSEGACEQRQQNVDGIRTRQCGGRQSAARETWTRACVAQRSRSGTTRDCASAIRKPAQTLRACQEQGEFASQVKS